MAGKIQTILVTKQEARSFLQKAMDFLSSAQVSRTLELWDSVSLLSVHATISAADALLGHHQGIRSVSSSHRDVIDLIRSISLAGKADEIRRQADRVSTIIGKKNLVAYEHRGATRDEASHLYEQAERFVVWVRANIPKG